MKVESPEQIRNIAVVGHSDTGKTSLVSAMLYTSGAVNRLTKVDDGNTVTDFDPEEIERKISIGVAPCFIPWRKYKINLLDCPGYGIFFTDTSAAMRVTDLTLLCVNAVAGIEVNTDKVWNFARRNDIPLAFHLTMMDRERADYGARMEELRERFGRAVVATQLPLGAEHDFCGSVDLLHKKAYEYQLDGTGKASEIEIPEELADAAKAARAQLIEAVAETSDALMEEYFDSGTLDDERLVAGLHSAVRKRKIFPVTVGAPVHMLGTEGLMDLLVDMAPAPNERPFPATDIGGEEGIEVETSPDGSMALLVFKTLNDPYSGKLSLFRVVRGTAESDSQVWNASAEQSDRMGSLLQMQGKQGTATPSLIAGDIGGVAKLKTAETGHTFCHQQSPLKLGWVPIPEPAMSFAIEPKSKGDEEKIGEALHRLMEEDPTLSETRDAETHEHLLSGAGHLHIDITVAKLKSRFGVEVVVHPPKVPYRETISRKAPGHGRHKKQSGGRGQFADCKIEIEPLPRGGDFEFVDQIFGGSIPQGFRPAVEKGIQEVRQKGFLAGYPLVDIRVRLLDGQYHDVDSSEMAFKIAGSLALKDAITKAGITLIEPVMEVDITTTEEAMGDIIGDLSQRRGRPHGMETQGSRQIVKATVPMSEMLNYASALRAMTQGRASFHMEYSHYEEVPKMIRDKIIAASKKPDEDE